VIVQAMIASSIRRYTDVAERPDGFVEAGRGREGWSLVLGILSIRILSALVQDPLYVALVSVPAGDICITTSLG
jgi:hypothetical protein